MKIPKENERPRDCLTAMTFPRPDLKAAETRAASGNGRGGTARDPPSLQAQAKAGGRSSSSQRAEVASGDGRGTRPREGSLPKVIVDDIAVASFDWLVPRKHYQAKAGTKLAMPAQRIDGNDALPVKRR